MELICIPITFIQIKAIEVPTIKYNLWVLLSVCPFFLAKLPTALQSDWASVLLRLLQLFRAAFADSELWYTQQPTPRLYPSYQIQPFLQNPVQVHLLWDGFPNSIKYRSGDGYTCSPLWDLQRGFSWSPSKALWPTHNIFPKWTVWLFNSFLTRY